MRHVKALLLVAVLGATWGPLVPGGVRPARGDDELSKHLEDLRRQTEDAKINIVRRQQLALEMAAALDRAGQSAPTIEDRRARWTEAIRVLDQFNRKNPGHPRAH